VVGVLHAEHGADGIRAYNVDPGHVTTERMQVNAAALGLAERYPGAPPSAPAAAIAWLVTAPEAAELSGQTVNGLKLALERAGHPDWRVKPGR
jgi:NAD(P)-dependent dehydrogenase (short-subunit alcohol dehydrogenase family)